jgi:hypothetical protein
MNLSALNKLYHKGLIFGFACKERKFDPTKNLS